MQKALAILVDGTTYFSWLFIVSLGLTLTYGVMKILNIAHGSFYALGAYAASSAIGAYLAGAHPVAGAYLVLFVAGISIGAVAGFLIERGLLRPMYGRDEIILVLVTYSIFLVLEDVIKLVWGVDPYFAPQPYELLGRVSIGGIAFATYDFALLALALLIGVLAFWALNYTRRGKLLIAVIHDREMSTGINVGRMFTATFVIGGMLGALGGAVTARAISVTPGIGVDVIVLAFAVSVTGGLGSVEGAALGALIVGMARALAVHLWPEVELFVIYAVMAAVLAVRPQGAVRSRRAAKDLIMRIGTVPALGVALVALVAVGPFLPAWAIFMLTVAFAKALVVLGLVIMMRAGLVSFGQGLFYGLGAYAAGLAANFLGLHDALLLALLGSVVAAVTGFVLGFVMARYREIFFAMLSLALSMILYGILVRAAALGSTDGFNLSPPSFFGIKVGAQQSGLLLYMLTVTLACGSAMALHRFVGSYAGVISQAILTNEIRVEYLGASVTRVLHLVYVIGAAMGGLGGALVALAAGHIDPELAYWTTSGEFVFVAILSGTGHVAAPLLGMTIFEAIRSFALEHSPYTWQMVVGLSMLAVILFLPSGLWSLFSRKRTGDAA